MNISTRTEILAIATGASAAVSSGLIIRDLKNKKAFEKKVAALEAEAGTALEEVADPTKEA